MLKLNRDEFEKIIEEGIRAVPEKFLRKLDNVAIVIDDEPTPAQKKKLNIHPSWTLYGLYEGVPQVSRGANYTAVLPDKILSFKSQLKTRLPIRKTLKGL